MATKGILGIADHRFYRLFTLSSKTASSVLHKVIEEFCAVNSGTFQHFLDHHKHDIFHLRSGAKTCCLCNRQFIKLLSDSQWNSLYKDTSSSLVPSHPHHGHDCKTCPEASSPPAGVRADVCDVTLAAALILNIKDLLLYFLDELCTYLGSGGSNGVEIFLAQHQHDLFHSMEKRRCCQCTNDPDGKDQIKPNEWSAMYIHSFPGCASPVCSCQYKPKPNVTLNTFPQQLRRKLGQTVSPIASIRSVRNSLAHSSSGTLDAAAFTTNWGVLAGALDDMLNTIRDSTWKADLKTQIADLKVCQISNTMWEEYHRDVHQWLKVCSVRFWDVIYSGKEQFYEVWFSFLGMCLIGKCTDFQEKEATSSGERCCCLITVNLCN